MTAGLRTVVEGRELDAARSSGSGGNFRDHQFAYCDAWNAFMSEPDRI
jgi:hypothetical protein